MLTDDQECEVLSAGLMLCDLEGIDGVSPADIAGLANIAVSDMTERFPAPEDVFRPIVAESIIQPMARTSAELPVGCSADRLRNYSGRGWEIINTPRFAIIYRLLINEVPWHPVLARLFADEVAGPIRRQIEGILSAREWPRVNSARFPPAPPPAPSRARWSARRSGVMAPFSGALPAVAAPRG